MQKRSLEGVSLLSAMAFRQAQEWSLKFCKGLVIISSTIRSRRITPRPGLYREAQFGCGVIVR
jgi:hypothetical protein